MFLKKFLDKNFPLTLIIILLTASFLRLYKIANYLTFLGDEGRDVLVVREILQGNLTLLGPRASAADFYLGPIYYYFMAPFLFLSGYHPVGPAIMVALFGIATVYLVYRVGRELFDVKAGLIAAALYAVSPLVIVYSRSSWNPNIMPFFSILTLYAAFKGIANGKASLLVLSGVFLGVSMQLHYLATFLAVILFAYILFSKILSKEKDRVLSFLKQCFSVVAGFLIGFSPFLIFEARHGFPNTKTILNFVFASGNVGTAEKLTNIIGDVFFRVFGRLLAFYPPPESVSIREDSLIAIWYYLTLLFAVSSVSLILYQLYISARVKSENSLKYLLVSLWILLGVALFGLYRKPIYDYYFGFMFPAPFLLVGNLFSVFMKKKGILASVALGAVLVLLYVNLQGSPTRRPGNRQYEQVKSVSKFILDKAESKPFNFALITGGNSDHAYRYIFEIEEKPPVTILNPQVDPDRKSVTDQLFIVCEENPCYPLGHSLWEIAGFGRAEIAGEWQVSVLKIYKLVHYKGE